MNSDHQDTTRSNPLDIQIVLRQDLETSTFMVGNMEVVVSKRRDGLDLGDIVRHVRSRVHFLSEDDSVASRRVVERQVRSVLSTHYRHITDIREINTIAVLATERFYLPLPEDLAAKALYESLAADDLRRDYEHNHQALTWRNWFSGRRVNRTWSQWFRGVTSRSYPRVQR